MKKVPPESMLDKTQARVLIEGARQLGIRLSEEDLTRFSLYLEELQRWSRVTDLVSQHDQAAIIRKHFLDSLALVPLLPLNCRVADLGSGAGFPGFILALLRSGQDIVLIESRRRRVNFLKEVARRTRAVNASVYEGRAEVLGEESSLRASFGLVVTRATWDIKKFLQRAHPFLIDNGTALIMKGPLADKELSEVSPCLNNIGFSLQRRHDYELPFGGETRCAISFVKEKCFM